MENLNAEQVKKELQEILDKFAGSLNRYYTLLYALRLINSQEQRIKELAEENERLRAEGENQSILWKQHFESIYETSKETVKADTVREMQERLKDEMRNTTKYSFGGREYSVIGEAFIDRIAKEMLEDAE